MTKEISKHPTDTPRCMAERHKGLADLACFHVVYWLGSCIFTADLCPSCFTDFVETFPSQSDKSAVIVGLKTYNARCLADYIRNHHAIHHNEEEE